MDAIAVVLAFEDYQNSIAKNLRVRDVAVDIYGVAMVPPPPPGRDLLSHQTGGEIFFTRPGREGNLFVHQTGGDKLINEDLVNEDLVSGGSRI